MIRHQILTIISAISSVVNLTVLITVAALIQAIPNIDRPHVAAIHSVLGLGIGWVCCEAYYRWAVVFRGKVDY